MMSFWSHSQPFPPSSFGNLHNAKKEREGKNTNQRREDMMSCRRDN